jgi:hypothetical protein
MAMFWGARMAGIVDEDRRSYSLPTRGSHFTTRRVRRRQAHPLSSTGAVLPGHRGSPPGDDPSSPGEDAGGRALKERLAEIFGPRPDEGAPSRDTPTLAPVLTRAKPPPTHTTCREPSSTLGWLAPAPPRTSVEISRRIPIPAGFYWSLADYGWAADIDKLIETGRSRT